MRRWIRNKIFAFRTNNNVLANMMAFASILWLVGNLYFVGLNSSATSPIETSDISAEAAVLEQYKGYLLDPYREMLSAEVIEVSNWENTKRFLSRWSWRLWGFIFLPLTLVVFPLSRRDEIGRGWEYATKRLQEKRGGEETAQAGPEGEGRTKPLGRGFFLIWEFVTDFMAEIFGHLVLGSK